ncbi:hypothetical protein [Algoriphagus marinus]|uniref:hypothetical protein n=1 Tax=Algoriphagus marinus TaxID=1925762 RepID=UPI00094B83DB|nr:hypothetical protein [Algoriphagus marinus]
MTLETLKLELIERVMKVEKASTLERIENILVQEEMQSRLNESLEAIEKGEVSTLDEFARSNQEWLKKRSSKL